MLACSVLRRMLAREWVERSRVPPRVAVGRRGRRHAPFSAATAMRVHEFFNSSKAVPGPDNQTPKFQVPNRSLRSLSLAPSVVPTVPSHVVRARPARLAYASRFTLQSPPVG